MIDKILVQINELRTYVNYIEPPEMCENFLDKVDALKDSVESYAITHPEKTDYEVPHYGQKINNFKQL